MRTNSPFHWLVSGALLLLGTASWLHAQSQEPEAVTWFQAGLKEKEPQRKIAAYQKAIAIDPLFIEALYNLGLIYKRQGDYTRAEQFFLKAYNARPDKLKNESKLQILYELATTYKKLGKFKEAEKSLQEAKRLAADPAMQARISLELGQVLSQQGRFEEALVELREGRGLNPATQGDFNTLIQSAETEIELQRLYQAAEKAKANGKLAEAKSLFEQIRAKRLGYRDVAAQIAALDSLLNAEAKKAALATLYEQAQKHAAEGKLEMAIAAYENLLQQAGAYKDAKARLEAARQQLEQKQLNERLESEYAAGLAALKARNWTRAILAFEKVLEWDRNFRDARKRLAEAQSGLDRESTETIVARYYAEGVAAMNRNDLGGALAALEKVRRINPNYRDTATLLAEIENALQNKKALAASSAVSAVSFPNLDSLYQAALVAFAQKDWMQAVINFEKIQLLQPNHRDVVSYLAQARANLYTVEPTEVVTTRQHRGSSSLFLGGSLVALMVLLGVIVFSPTVRARVHLMRGNYAAAALLYEGLLARHPHRMKLYPTLANFYLLLGRTDEKALKVFKTVLQLNLATSHRDEITSIVGQNYLQEGRTDADAIEVLESALQAERRKQGQPKKS